MPGILIQTDNLTNFRELVHGIISNVDLSDTDLSIQIDGDGFGPYPQDHTELAESEESKNARMRNMIDFIDKVVPAPTAFDKIKVNSASLHNVASGSNTIRQSIPPEWKLGAGSPLETSSDCAYFPPIDIYPNPEAKSTDELFGYKHYRTWSYSAIQNAWLKCRASYPSHDEVNMVADLLNELIEMPLVIEHSELYQQCMAAISAAAHGNIRGYELTSNNEYLGPALTDVCGLYDKYYELHKGAQADTFNYKWGKEFRNLMRQYGWNMYKCQQPILEFLSDKLSELSQTATTQPEEAATQAFIDRDRDQAVNSLEWYREEHKRQREQYIHLHKQWEAQKNNIAFLQHLVRNLDDEIDKLRNRQSILKQQQIDGANNIR